MNHNTNIVPAAYRRSADARDTKNQSPSSATAAGVSKSAPSR